MTILDQIIENKKIEVARAKEKVSVEELQNSVYFKKETISLKSALLAQNSTGIKKIAL
jgi:indole-3-glycerol phosphate synthase